MAPPAARKPGGAGSMRPGSAGAREEADGIAMIHGSVESWRGARRACADAMRPQHDATLLT